MGAEPRQPQKAREQRFFQPFFFQLFFVVAVSIGMTGCVDTLEPSSRKPQVNAPGVPVALVSLDGAPEAIVGRFQAALSTEATRREISLVQGSETPRYKLKGYLSAYDVEGGTALAWVWDMYDSAERRAKRVDGAQLVKRNGAEPWSVVDDAVLQVAAASSMNEVASYLANAPLASSSPATAPNAPQRPAIAGAPVQAAAMSPARNATAVSATTLPSRSAATAFDLTPGAQMTNRALLSASTLGLAAQ